MMMLFLLESFFAGLFHYIWRIWFAGRGSSVTPQRFIYNGVLWCILPLPKNCSSFVVGIYAYRYMHLAILQFEKVLWKTHPIFPESVETMFCFPHDPKTVQSSSPPQKERQRKSLLRVLPRISQNSKTDNFWRNSWEMHSTLFLLLTPTPQTRPMFYHQLASMMWTLNAIWCRG